MIQSSASEFSRFHLIDDLPPEDLAMLQALYSRSSASVLTHLEKLKETGSGKFMSKFYVGYGHKSIADCGSTTLFIEGVSMLAAKAIQNWALYSGQETSTRYIDMSKQKIVDPANTSASKEILDRWMEFYTESGSNVREHIRSKYPKKDGEKEDVYENAVNARSFDILRGFLPAGVTTNLSWHTNIRQADDHLVDLSNHPCDEIRKIAFELRQLLSNQYQSSGGLPTVTGVDSRDEVAAGLRHEWERSVGENIAYPPSKAPLGYFDHDISHSTTLPNFLRTRPRGCVLPHFLTDLGQLDFRFLLDFGSFRDIQRHRNGVIRMPKLTLVHGFEKWYLAELPENLQRIASMLLDDQESEISNLTISAVEKQYYIAMGYLVPTQLTVGLPSAVYIMEMRSGKMIHPTLRSKIHWMIQSFRREFGESIALHVDMSPSDWDVRRGHQTIQAK
jgi:thymidylate synthase ThyX